MTLPLLAEAKSGGHHKGHGKGHGKGQGKGHDKGAPQKDADSAFALPNIMKAEYVPSVSLTEKLLHGVDVPIKGNHGVGGMNAHAFDRFQAARRNAMLLTTIEGNAKHRGTPSPDSRSVAGQSTRSSRSGAKAPDDPLAFLDDWNPRDAPGAPASVSTTRDDSSVQEQGSSRASKGTGSGMALPGVYGSVTGGRSPERARAPGGAGAPPPLAAEASQVSQASKASGTSRYSSLSNGTAGRVAGGNGRSPLRPGAPRAAPGRRRTLVGHKPTVFTSGQGRISRHLAAHDANNWMDRLVTNNYVASIIQAWFKGYRVRKEWKKDPKRLADRVHAQAMAEIAAERGVPLHTLERSYEEEEGPRAMDQNHYEHLKKMVQLKMTLGKRKDIYMRTMKQGWNVGDKTTGQKLWLKLQAGAKGEVRRAHEESDDSDVDAEEIQGLKFRPNTPPWAHVDAVQTAGLQARLLGVGAWVDRGKTDVIWDPAENKDRITQVMARRKTGPPRSMRLEQAQQVSALLLPRYAAKYERMGVPERMPGRKAYLELLANKPPTPPPAALAVAGEEGGAAKGGAEGDAAPAPAVEAAPAPA